MEVPNLLTVLASRTEEESLERIETGSVISGSIRPRDEREEKVISSSPTQLVTSQSAGKSKERRTQPSGARGRGGKSVRGQKRPRTSGQSLLESDTQSDDDDGFGSSMNMTVSVPPVRGSDTMPTRLCVYIIHFFLSLFLSFLSLSFLLSLSLFFPLYIR